MTIQKKQPIQVVDRAFDILELLAKQQMPMRSNDIAATLKISVQSANNLLRTMYNRGYISQNENRNYLLGPQCVYVGRSADRWEHIRQIFSSPVLQLAHIGGFISFAGVIENDKLLCVALAGPKYGSVQYPPQTWADELHSTACGRILLASLAPIERKKLFARTTRRKMTRTTVIEPDELEKICVQIQLDGFAEVRNESREGTSSLAIPIRDISGKIFAGLAVSALNTDWEKKSFEEKVQILNTVRSKIEQR